MFTVAEWITIHKLRHCCSLILPTVFSEEMSYYEVLCKVQKLLNDVIDDIDWLKNQVDINTDDIAKLKSQIEQIINGDYEFLKQILDKAIKNVWFGLTDTGYFVAYIPESWDDIKFSTTGYDINLVCHPEYGHLVLSY